MYICMYIYISIEVKYVNLNRMYALIKISEISFYMQNILI